MFARLNLHFQIVHYRTGSLESNLVFRRDLNSVHYRTGSLEMAPELMLRNREVHYRTGSLEMSQH